MNLESLNHQLKNRQKNEQQEKLKALVLSLGLAALMVPATLNAQINHGLLQNPYKTESGKNHSMLKQNREGGFSITHNGIGQSEPEAPLGSGIAIMLAAGLGYVALKKKEDEQ